jgi:hypothetical protein
MTFQSDPMSPTSAPPIDECPACAQGRGTVVAQLDTASRERFLAFSAVKFGGLLDDWLESVPPVVMHCPRCDHHWYRHQPSPERLALMYASGRRLGNGPPPSVQPSGDMRREMQRLHRLCGGLPGLRLLDFGAGSGRWSRAACDAGFEVAAFEPSASRSDSGHDRYELVHELGQLTGRRFDTIQLEQVLEHVPSPFDTLTLLRSLCRPGTVLRITVPNLWREAKAGPIWSRWPWDGESVHVLAPFEHLHGFSARSLDALLARSGYRSTTTVSAWRHYPANEVRRLIGAFWPAVSTTLRVVVAGDVTGGPA